MSERKAESRFAGPCPLCKQLNLVLYSDGTFDCDTVTIGENVLTGERHTSRCLASGLWERSGGAVGAIKIKTMIERTVCGKCGAAIEKDRLAIVETPLCAKCAAETPGNILQDQRTQWHDPETLANDLYTHYCQMVGGKAWNGDPLPTWEQFYSSNEKRVQSHAWVCVAARAIERLRPQHASG